MGNLQPDYFRTIVPVAAMLVWMAFYLLRNRSAHAIHWELLVILVLLAGSAMFHFTRSARDGSHPDQVNPYEFFHYYAGAKYFEELGNTRLYGAAVIAQVETGVGSPPDAIRNLEDYSRLNVDAVLQDPNRWTSRFTPERWEEFRRDIRYFREYSSARLWKQMLNDKGFNATPVWSLFGGRLATRISTASPWGMRLLSGLDLILLFVAFSCVWWAYHPRTALLFLTLFGSHYLIAEHYTLRFAFLRIEWAMCLVMAVCMLKRGHNKTAGVLTMGAGLLRIFPLVFFFGMGAKALWDVKSRRTAFLREPPETRTGRLLFRSFLPGRKYVEFFAAAGLAGLVLAGASVLWGGGLAVWRDYLGKIMLHNSDIAAWRIGFKYVFLLSYNGAEFWGRDLKTVFEQHQLIWWCIQGVILTVVFFSVRSLDDDEAMAMGYVPAFFLVAPTYYYQVMLLVPFLFFATRSLRPERLAGMFLLFSISLVANACYGRWGRGYTLFFVLSCLLMLFSLYMVVCAFLSPIKPSRGGFRVPAKPT